jgi:hypothetical protein
MNIESECGPPVVVTDPAVSCSPFLLFIWLVSASSVLIF